VYDYSNSEWVKSAKYQIALVDTARSALPGYDQKITQAAVRQLEEFVDVYPDAEFVSKAQQEISQLQEKEAESSFLIARFYEKQKNYTSARIYYQSIVDQFPNSSWAPKAIEQISIIKDRQNKQKK
ncbi:MAG: outer membrane protein assembly factor BamD, partial [Methanomicrobia archaeon]|nr:outer membrane protein assembly factor BamD [Methanomicrobia archaeon]